MLSGVRLYKIWIKMGYEEIEIFEYGFAELTESEANYLIRAESFESIRNKIIETAKQGQ